jgi:hypothetical protein
LSNISLHIVVSSLQLPTHSPAASADQQCELRPETKILPSDPRHSTLELGEQISKE